MGYVANYLGPTGMSCWYVEGVHSLWMMDENSRICYRVLDYWLMQRFLRVMASHPTSTED